MNTDLHFATAGRFVARELRKRVKERGMSPAEATESIKADVDNIEKPEDAEGFLFRAIIEISNTEQYANDMDAALDLLKSRVRESESLDELQWS